MGLAEISGRAAVATAALRSGDPADVLPVVPPLDELFPGGGLRRGSVVVAGGSTSLPLAVLAAASRAGSWSAAVGLPAMGPKAAHELGVDLGRFALVPRPGERWTAVVAALLDALDLVLVRPPGRVRPGEARALAARARERGAVLVVAGDWDGADLHLAVTRAEWEGLGPGHGRLLWRRVEVRAAGRGTAARERRVVLWWPGPPPDGSPGRPRDGRSEGGRPGGPLRALPAGPPPAGPPPARRTGG